MFNTLVANAQEKGTGLIACVGLECDSWSDVVNTIQNVINFSFKAAVFLATISFAVAGWKYLTARGDTGKVGEAHKIFLMVVKGFIVMSLAWLLVNQILTMLVNPGYNLLK